MLSFTVKSVTNTFAFLIRSKNLGLMAIVFAMLFSISAYGSNASQLSFIDSTTEFLGLQSNVAPIFSSAETSGTGNQIRLVVKPSGPAASFVNVSVSLPNVSSTPGSISVPITVGSVTGLGVISYDLNVDYNAAVVMPLGDASCSSNTCVTQTGTLSGGMSITPNVNNIGHFIVSGFQGQSLSGTGTLLILNFSVIGTAGQSSPLNFADYMDPGMNPHSGFVFNEGDPTASPVTNGSITIPGGVPTNTATNTPTATSTATFTPTATNTATNTPTPTSTNTSTPTNPPRFDC